jgi:hypothetical protein
MAAMRDDAVAFVLGALLVGLIALGRELLVDRRRWKREEAAYGRVTRAARRLVADELDTVANHLALMLRRDMWPVSEVMERARFLPNAEWERRKERLAEAVNDENTWVVLASFQYTLGQLRARALGEPGAKRLEPTERERVQTMYDQAKVLHGVLADDIPLPDDWEEQLAAVRQAGKFPMVAKNDVSGRA